MNPARRPRQRGAVVAVMVVLFQFVFAGSLVAMIRVGTAAAETRATTGADAAAHAAVAELAGDQGRGDLSAALQSGKTCAIDEIVGPQLDDLDGGSLAVCRAAINSATAVARSNGATLVSIRIGPDPKGWQVGSAGPALFEVLTEASVAGPLRATTPLCADHQSRRDLCWAYAWSAAREAG